MGQRPAVLGAVGHAPRAVLKGSTASAASLSVPVVTLCPAQAAPLHPLLPGLPASFSEGQFPITHPFESRTVDSRAAHF